MSQHLLTLLLFVITASWKADTLDPGDLDATFASVFAKLPAELTIFPSENYYYWQIETSAGDTVWGNVRLAANRRDHGELSFAAGTKYKTFSARDGVRVERLGRLEYAVTFNGKRVVFHLNPLVQKPPEKFALREGEQFVQRTYDESGLQFVLLYSSRFDDFLWVLNEEAGVKIPETFADRNGALIGERSGFVFWQDRDRKVLCAVSRANVEANNYFDGPFDQLADNHAEETSLKKFLVQRNPAIASQIDQFGNHKNRDPATRVALTNYLKYKTLEQASDFVREAQRSADPHRHISKAGKKSR